MHYKELLDEIRKIILKHANPDRIYLYGSRANGEATETSDIDIAYEDQDKENIRYRGTEKVTSPLFHNDLFGKVPDFPRVDPIIHCFYL